MAKCLVLGANGFIGSHLVDALVDQGHSVRAFDRTNSSTIRYKKSKNVDSFLGDFLNRDDLEKAVDGVDYVFHFISTTTPATAENDPLIDVDTNIKMSIILFELCVQKNIRKVIFASTGGAIYGSTSGEPIPESTTPNPVSPYAIGKLTIEHYLNYFDKKYGLKSLVYRISNPYGERHALHAKQGVINIFLEQISSDKSITILGNGTMVRDYIYVTDVAEMISRSFEVAKKQLYNLGSGKGSSINEIVNEIEKIVEKKINKEFADSPPTFINKVVLDTTQFNDEFSLLPRVSMEEGLRKTWLYVNQSLREENA